MTKDSFRAFVAARAEIASRHGLKWDVRICWDGTVHQQDIWDLCSVLQLPRSPKSRITDLGVERKALVHLPNDPQLELSRNWIDLIKAAIVDWVFVERRLPGTVQDRRVRPLRVLATCAGKVEPWDMSPGLARRTLEIAASIAPAVRESVETCLGRVMDDNQISAHGPLLAIALAGADRASWAKPSTAVPIRHNLSDRKSPEKLPGAREWDEMWRIALTEHPKTLSDAILFETIKVHGALGFRIADNCIIPLDWRRQKEHKLKDGRSAEEAHGFSTSIGLRHFPGKQRGRNEDSSLLYEDVLDLPPRLAPMIVEALENIERLTVPLRRTYKAQVESGRLFPEFERDQLVPAWEFYPRLSGDVRLTVEELPPDLEGEYRANFNPEILDRMWLMQTPPQGPLRKYVVMYFLQFGKRAAGGRLFPARTSDGSEWTGPIQWKDAYVRVGELEDAARVAMPTKVPEVVPFRLEHGARLYPHECLILMPGRAITEARNGNILDVNRYCSVRLLTPSEYRRMMGGRDNNIFSRYGRTPEDRALVLTKTHADRHLINTELFRQNVPDTAITKIFNRRSVAQSYVYDHRSLAEDLDAIELPESAKRLLPEPAQKLLKAIGTGKAAGPVIDEYYRVVEAEGESAGLEFLAGEVGGYHTTPYGICTQSFLTSGCPMYLECFNGCSCLVKTDDPEADEALQTMEVQLGAAVKHIENASPNTPGRAKQLEQTKNKLANVTRLRDAMPGQKAFPEGADLSGNSTTKRTPLDIG
ncbi:hypothetical protein LB545_01240 [Mesorhizobium sp. BR1-1-6]|uniref:hypothetical protein n=1 Tax=Mesorhizobium sp. BR1-1-6 TaxID=2876648 RepID=UPI001CD06EB9|nr:hypothetical protein [Mesorhizobium sp. BR1-1-6]MBZ9892949.1 hypothetical protein [Mesorhizobium sp. BR1-1-6]